MRLTVEIIKTGYSFKLNSKMAHAAQREFVEFCLARFATIVSNAVNILEVGSQNINGSIRNHFPGAENKGLGGT